MRKILRPARVREVKAELSIEHTHVELAVFSERLG